MASTLASTHHEVRKIERCAHVTTAVGQRLRGEGARGAAHARDLGERELPRLDQSARARSAGKRAWAQWGLTGTAR